MPCYGPLAAYRSADVNPETGRRPLVFGVKDSHSGVKILIPCGQCIGCKLERSRQWAMRCLHEMKEHYRSGSAFLTLTYQDKFVPTHGSLRKRHLQLFMKKLRHRRPAGLRFYGCGEYGELSGRPHYHVLLLNTCFSDMKKMSWGMTDPSPYEKYVSAELDALWGYGQCVIAEVNFETCAYVARYCTKVISGDRRTIHPKDGYSYSVRSARDWYYGREPEFAVMSRRPGIGMAWFNKYKGEWYAHDSAVVNAREVPLTRFYDSKYEVLSNEVKPGKLLSEYEVLKRERRRKVDISEQVSRRLQVKERLACLTMAHFKKGSL